MTDLTVLMHIPAGQSIFSFSHLIYNRQQAESESEPCRSNGLLPATKRRNARSDFSANLLDCPVDRHPFPSAALPRFQPIID